MFKTAPTPGAADKRVLLAFETVAEDAAAVRPAIVGADPSAIVSMSAFGTAHWPELSRANRTRCTESPLVVLLTSVTLMRPIGSFNASTVAGSESGIANEPSDLVVTDWSSLQFSNAPRVACVEPQSSR